jgi:nucleotide-binding universal stress UspA family protein
MTSRVESGPVVVVGIDGSANSAAALRWAGSYATLIGAELHAVIACEGLMGFAFAPVSTEDLERESRHVLDRTIHKVFGAKPPVRVVKIVDHGNPTAVLVDESRGADLLVVGDRGYGGFAGLLLGSVGGNCVREAHCSVIVVRDQS